MAQSNVRVGDIENVSGEVTIAGGDINKGFTAEQVSALLTQITSTFQVKKFDGRCPYKGLDVFDEEDADLFFGRERLVNDLVNRVKESQTVFITGPSGSGKSSLVRAGLIHALKQGAIKNSKSWLYETIKPGRDPLESLALAFSRLKSPELANYFRGHVSEANILHECTESALSDRKNQRLILFIDQFEEIFTQVGKEKAETFINILTNASRIENGRVIILFSMRSDFVSNCATYPELNDLLNRQFIQIGAMQPDELVSAIAQPALRVGLRIDPDLVAQIINDMRGEPGVLPLMQFALKDLFDAQEATGGMVALTLNGYLQRGGIHKALERHADNAFSKLSASEQELARIVFCGLIEIGRGTQDTRRTALFNELIPSNHKVEDVTSTVQKLADARLITTDEQAGVDIITISHEKLIDAWPWLKELINENRDVIALQNEIASDAKEWEEHKRDASYLYTGARLINAREQMEGKKLSLSGLAQEFVQKGSTRQRNRQMAIISGVSFVIVLLALAAIVFNNQANTSERIANTAQAANTEAVAQRATAQAASTLAVEQQLAAEANANEALARQLAAQAQSVNASQNSNQMIAALLSIESMKLFPIPDAASFLINNNKAARPISSITLGITHEGIINSVVFSPDGKYVVSVSHDKFKDGTVCVWEAANGRKITCTSPATLSGWRIGSVVFSQDKTQVALIGSSFDPFALTNIFSVLDVFTGTEIVHAEIEGVFFYSVVFNSDGKYVVSGSNDGIVRVWETSTGKEVDRMNIGKVLYVDFISPDGKYGVVTKSDNTAYVLEISSGKEISHVNSINSDLYSFAFSPDGRYWAAWSFNDGIVHLWETSTGKEVEYITFPIVSAVTFSPDGNYLIASGSNKIRMWKISTGKEFDTATMNHDSPINTIAISPNGKYVVSGSDDGTARVWEIFTGKEITRMTHDGSVDAVAFSPDGKYVVSGSRDGTVRIWEIPTTIASVAFSPDGKYMASGSDDGITSVRELSTNKEIAHMSQDGRVDAVAFSPDGKYVVSGSEDSTVRIWEVITSREIVRTTIDGFRNYSVAFSPNGKQIGVISSSTDRSSVTNIAFVLDAFTGKEIAHLATINLPYTVAFSLDGNYVILNYGYGNSATVWEVSTGVTQVNVVLLEGKYGFSSGGDGTIRVFETLTGKEIAHMYIDNWDQISISPDGKHVASKSNLDRTTIHLWETATGKEIARVTDREIGVFAFSPDGRYIVSGGCDKYDKNDDCIQRSAHVWEATTGKEVARITHENQINSVAFSPDGRYVVSGECEKYDENHACTQSSAHVWEWQAMDIIANACVAMPRNLTRIEWERYISDALPYQAVCWNLPIEPEPTATP